MPNYTAKGFPYSDGAESVASVDDTMQELAEEIDANVGRHAAGRVTGLATGGATTASVAVSFPVGRFTAAPIVVCNIESGYPAAGTTQNAFAWASGVTSTGFTMNYRRGAADTGNILWIAVEV